MRLLEAILLALSLCADCFAVAICASVSLRKVRLHDILRVGLVFSVVQTAFFLLGWGFADLIAGYVSKIAHWIGFLLLLYVGGSMIREGLEQEPEECVNLDGIRNLLIAGVADSIDALAVGVSMSLAQNEATEAVPVSAAIFGCTFLSVAVGMPLGSRIGEKFGKVAEIVGGCVLILIGLDILLGLF